MGIVEGACVVYTIYITARLICCFAPGGEMEEFFAESGW